MPCRGVGPAFACEPHRARRFAVVIGAMSMRRCCVDVVIGGVGFVKARCLALVGERGGRFGLRVGERSIHLRSHLAGIVARGGCTDPMCCVCSFDRV